jgi:hypothetical protein
MKIHSLERLKKYCRHLERGFFGFWRGFGEGAGLKNPVTEPKRGQNKKRPLLSSFLPNGDSIFENTLWFVALACALCGCASEPIVAYNAPLLSPGGKFSKLPPTVQNSVRAEAGMAEIHDILKGHTGNATFYEVTFRYPDINPPLYLAPDGSVLTPDLHVAVGATEDTIEASTGSGVSSIKLDTLPSNVVQTIRHSAPTAEVNSIARLNSGGDVFYDVTFKEPGDHPRLLIRDDGRLVR